MVLRIAQCSRPARRLDDGGPWVPPSFWGLCAALLAAGLGPLGALAGLARSAVGLTGLALPVGLAGVGGLLAALLRNLLLRLLLLLRGLLLATTLLLGGLLLGGLLLLLSGSISLVLGRYL